MKTLFLLRHAKSSWDDSTLDDHDRPLNQRGYLEAPRVGGFLKQKGWIPGLVISSSALRAKDTAELVIRACGYDGQLLVEPGLYGASLQFFGKLIKSTPDRLNSLLLVGHNPDMEELIQALTRQRAVMSTATLAKLDLPLEDWADIGQVGSRDKKADLKGTWQGKHLSAD